MHALITADSKCVLNSKRVLNKKNSCSIMGVKIVGGAFAASVISLVQHGSFAGVLAVPQAGRDHY